MENENTWSGERLETFILNSNTVEHLHRYSIAIRFIKNKTVLDIACGEGYGSNLLAKYATAVIGVDSDELTINAATTKYKGENLEFKVGSADSIPLKTSSVDVVVSFETLEHHDKHNEMLSEIKRVLVPNGILIMSSPNKTYYSDVRDYKNPFHVKELYPQQFKDLINAYFLNTTYYIQNMFNGSLIIPEQKSNGFDFFEGDYQDINLASTFKPMYCLVIASDNAVVSENGISCFNGETIFLKEQALLSDVLTKQAREDGIHWIKNSWSYKIGNAILKPFKFFRR